MKSRISFFLLAFFLPSSLGWSVPVFQQTSTSSRGMVVSADSLASVVGREILKKGGNAVDAGVAVGFALAVTFPIAGNIGGGGFMVIRLADGRTTTVDFRERAPLAATRDMFLNKKGEFQARKTQKGPLAAGVPGSVAGLLMALERYGSMKREAVLRPAIDLARSGFQIKNRFLAREIEKEAVSFQDFPTTKAVFLPDGRPIGIGDTLRQSELAATLELIKEKGKEGFYRGENAERILEGMRRYGGIMSRKDLESYEAIERPAVQGSYRGYDIITMGPPSSGGAILVEMLNILEGFNLRRYKFGSVATTTILAEIMKLAYADRAEFFGDPDFVRVPVEQLVSKHFAESRRKVISVKKATPSKKISAGSLPPPEHTETTHFSIIDRWGNCVSVTMTINDFFGCGFMVEGGGFFLNNEMDDFSAKPGVPNQFGLVGGAANSIAPGKRMLSGMTPTIVLYQGRPFMILGSPGGPKITTTVLQVLVNVVDFGLGMKEAIDAPRVHHQWLPDTLYYERGGLAPQPRRMLKNRGFSVVQLRGEYGRVEGILVNPDGTYTGVSDRRGNGAALGYDERPFTMLTRP